MHRLQEASGPAGTGVGDGDAPAWPASTVSGCTYRRAPYPAAFTSLLGLDAPSHCRYLWSPALKKGAWQAIGRRDHGRPVTTLLQFSTAALSKDVFLSPNQFFDWRNVRQLAQLHANWLEIDTRAHAPVGPEDEATIVAEALAQLEAAGIPAPTGYVHSGSGGVHLYWIYQGVEAFRWRVSMWRGIADRLIGAVRGGALWQIDPGPSRDPARVLRLPGSIHSKTGRLVHPWIGGPIYEFHQLAAAVGVSNQAAAVDAPKKRPPATTPTSPITEKPAPAAPSQRHTIGQWWGKVFFHTLSHARKRGVPEGQRDNLAFILYVALRHLQDDETAFARLQQINDELIHLTPDELAAYLSTARRVHYKYRKDTLRMFLADALGMDTDFLDHEPRPALPIEEIRRRQSLAGEITSQYRRLSTLERLQAALNDLADTSIQVTQAMLATLAGVSERTVRRYWGVVQDYLANRSRSIYAPR